MMVVLPALQGVLVSGLECGAVAHVEGVPQERRAVGLDDVVGAVRRSIVDHHDFGVDSRVA